MFSFFRKKPPAPAQPVVSTPPETLAMPALMPAPAPVPADVMPPDAAPEPLPPAPGQPPAASPAPAPARSSWIDKLKTGLRKTGASIATVFTGTQIDDALYEDLETALLMADTGVKATEHLLQDLKRRVKDSKTTDPAAVKGLLVEALTSLLTPLQKPLVIGRFKPTVIMVAGVNGAGKTTSIGKLTRHLVAANASVLLAAADTFRAAAREQLGVWADRTASRSSARKAATRPQWRSTPSAPARPAARDVVLVDTAGRLPTQLHLMEELKKIKRVIAESRRHARRTRCCW